MELVLVDVKDAMCAAWAIHFKELPNVTIVNDRFQAVLHYDCIVSPANSFGLMDGGFDYFLTQYFGVQLMQRVQAHILQEYRGEQNVGTSFIIETRDPRHPFLAHTPTMRVPMTIAYTDHVYRAMLAMLLAVEQHNRTAEQKIETVLCPGLGTGVGQVPYGEAARQMALAYRNFLNPPTRMDWAYASTRQAEIRFGGDDGFNFAKASEKVTMRVLPPKE